MKAPLVFVFGLVACQFLSAQGTFTSVDIGSKTPAGITTTVANGFDVGSSTGDIWSGADDCRFVYQSVTGDFDLQTRVNSLTGTAYWAKAGLMLRRSTQDTAEAFSMLATRAGGFGYYICMSRTLAGYGTYAAFAGSLTNGRVSYPNTWVRLVRVGDRAVAQHSTNGVDWNQIGVETLYEFTGTALAGMAVSTHTDVVGQRTTAQFRDVRLTKNQIGAPVVVEQPESLLVNPGTNVVLSVVAAGMAPLSYQWFRNDEPLDGMTGDSISLTNLMVATAGRFSCLVTNALGRVWSWAGVIEVAAPHEPFDGILYERFDRVHSLQMDYLTRSPAFPDQPASRSYRTLAELPSNAGENIGSRLRGYLLAPQTGSYTFWIAADDNGELWLSPEDNPANRKRIAYCPYYVGSREWGYFSTQRSAPVQLKAGRRYYFEALFKEADVADHGAVGWQLPNGTMERPIPVSRFRGEPARLSAASVNQIDLMVTGSANSLYVLEHSTDLAKWLPVHTNRVPFLFDINAAAKGSSDFFRAVTER